MHRLTRRSFGKKLLAAGAFSLIEHSPILPQTSNAEPDIEIPDSIAGYTLSAEDKQLAGKFLMNHEQNMNALRETDLPNSLPPDFIFSSPKVKGEIGDAKR
ncbi:MAG: hypothetical protein KF749_09095 [Bacteroidetes bacterium]|nr:hypothetical protein [Bacteroidota bacterium]MCW5894780.1 hypothetical protein [Bacteroidota bacterium]